MRGLSIIVTLALLALAHFLSVYLKQNDALPSQSAQANHSGFAQANPSSVLVVSL